MAELDIQEALEGFESSYYKGNPKVYKDFVPTEEHITMNRKFFKIHKDATASSEIHF